MRGVFTQTLKRLASLSTMLALSLQSALPATAFGVPPAPGPNEVAYWCATGVKFGSNQSGVGSHTQNPITITIAKNNNDKTVLSSASGTNVTITKIVIKGGNDGGDGNGNQAYTSPFTYPLSAPHNNGGQQSDISHVIVCYEPANTITIVKNAIPDSTQDFSFTSNVQGNLNFQLDDESGATTDNVPESKVFSGLAAGTYTFTESPVAGWYLDAIDCPNISETKDVAARTVSLTVTSGMNITCTFTNRPAPTGSIKVIKDVINDNGGTKTYADFSFSVGGNNYGFDATTSPDGEKTVSLPVGTYSVVENEASALGYQATYENCANITVVSNQTVTCKITNNDQASKLIVKKVIVNDNGGDKTPNNFSFRVNDGPAVGFEADGQNDMVVPAGSYKIVEIADNGYTTTYDNCDVTVSLNETKTCTITNNDKAPKVRFEKHTNVDSDQAFSFSGTNGNFTMSDGGSYIPGNLKAGDSFTVTENAVPGWFLSPVQCTGSQNWTQQAHGVKVDLKAGDDVVCKFFNVKRGSISGFKLNDANGNALFDDNEEKLPGWTIQLWGQCEEEVGLELLARLDTETSQSSEDCFDLIDETVTDGDGNYAFTDVPDGRYFVCEVMRDGWTRTFPADSNCHEVFVDDGKDCIANFANKAKALGNVLSGSTPPPPPAKVLANTGLPLSYGLFVGSIIIGAASGVTYLSRKQYR